MAGVICLYYMHLLKRPFPRVRGRRRADRQTDDQTSSLLLFLVCLHDSVSAQHLSHGQTRSFNLPAAVYFPALSLSALPANRLSLPWAPYPFPLRSLGNRTFKAAHLKAGPTQQSLMGPWEVAPVTRREGNNIVAACWGFGTS